MKLKPPGSSSDLEVARAIARRLHQRARGSESAVEAEAAPPPVFERRAPPGPGVFPPGTPSIPPEALEPEPALTSEPPELEKTPPALEPEPPELSIPEEPPPPPTPKPFEPEMPEGFEPDTGAVRPDSSAPAAPVEETPFEPEPPGGYTIDADAYQQELPGGPAAGEPSWGGDEIAPNAIGGNVDLEGLEAPNAAGVSPEDLIPDEGPAGPGVSPEDLLSDQPPAGPGLDEPSLLEAEVEIPGQEAPAQDMVEVPEQSWDDVADSCLALAPAHGAMLVDPAGQVLTARGAWPEPGPEAIAGRLVSMMEKKLRDAPTRSVSAPLAGLHLTAWRVPAEEGYLTVVFMADAPLRADVRPAIDTTIQAAAG